MLDQIAETIRTQVLAGSGIDVDRSYVAPGGRWAREGCEELVVEYVTTRRSTLGQGPTPAQQGVGFSGQQATVRHHDLRVTLVQGCYPVAPDPDTPADDAEVNAWTAAFLADVDAVDRALPGVSFAALGIMSELTIGPTEPFGPDGGVARVTWPVSISEL